MSVSLWLDLLVETAISSDSSTASQTYSELFTLDLYEAQVSSLQNDIWDRNLDIVDQVGAQDLYDGDWPGFEELARSYLKFCKNVNPNDIRESYDLYASFLVDLQSAFTNSRGSVLVQTVVLTSKILIPLALRLDAEDSVTGTSGKSTIRTYHLSSVLLKIFNSIRAEKPDIQEQSSSGVAPGTKKSIILYVAVMLCRLYYQMDQLPSCANVFSNIHSARIAFTKYPKSQKVEYRFWLGRYYLLKNELVHAYCHLYWAFLNCHSGSFKNQRLILKYLVPAAILLGKMPSIQLLQSYDLYGIYGPLVKYLREPNFRQAQMYLDANQAWFQKRSLYMLISTKSIVLMLRTVFYKLWKALEQSSTVLFPQLITALEMSNWPGLQNDSSIDDGYDNLIAENVCISLISQGLAKGNIFTRTKAIRLRAVDPLPKLAALHNISSSGPIPVAGREKWMEG